jgi:hypothetical protein
MPSGKDGKSAFRRPSWKLRIFRGGAGIWPIGWMVLCLLLCLGGCSAGRELVPAPLVIRERPPALLLKPVPAPRWRGRTNRDLLEYALRLEAALGEANARLAALQSWAADGSGDAGHAGR